MPISDPLADKLDAILRADPDMMRLLSGLRSLALPDWRVVSGAVYQTVWNALTDRPRGHGIKDWDVAYFDDTDLSWEAEDAVIRRVEAAFPDGPSPIEVRNQARVHLWYEAKFGHPVEPLTSTDESLTRYASRVHAIGVRLEDDDTLSFCAPFGLTDLFTMRVLPNKDLPNEKTHHEKMMRCKELWPEIQGETWEGLPV